MVNHNPGGISGYDSDTLYNKYYYPGYTVVNPALVIYNGSKYTFASEVYAFHYSDYNDS